MKVEQTCAEAQRASRTLSGLPRARKDQTLHAVADALRRRSAEILAENAEDVRLARENRLADVLVDRLLLDDDRLADVEAAVRSIAALPDPVGEVVDGPGDALVQVGAGDVAEHLAQEGVGARQVVGGGAP